MRAFELMEDEVLRRITSQDMIDLIKRDCIPWLSATRSSNHPVLYRGLTGRDATFIKMTVRQDRNPLSSTSTIHEFMNKSIQSLGLKANRTNSFFGTTIKNDAAAYGNVYMVIPIGDFSFTWNTKADDATVYLSSRRDEIVQDIDPRDQEAIMQRAKETLIDVNYKEFSNAENKIYSQIINNLMSSDYERLYNEAKEKNPHLSANTWKSEAERHIKAIAFRKMSSPDVKSVLDKINKDIEDRIINDPKNKATLDKLSNVAYLSKYWDEGKIDYDKFYQSFGQYFTDQDLPAAMKSGHEIMINCQNYYAIDADNEKVAKFLLGGRT